MGITEQVISLVLLLVVLVLSIFLIVFALGVVEFNHVVHLLAPLYGQFSAAIIGGLLLILSLITLRSLFSFESGTDTVIQDTDFGEVRVAIHAVDSLVHSVTSSIVGVSDVRTRIEPEEEGIRVHLKLVIESGSVVPDLAQEIQSKITDYIKTTLGLSVTGVRITIRNISERAVEEHKQLAEQGSGGSEETGH